MGSSCWLSPRAQAQTQSASKLIRGHACFALQMTILCGAHACLPYNSIRTLESLYPRHGLHAPLVNAVILAQPSLHILYRTTTWSGKSFLPLLPSKYFWKPFPGVSLWFLLKDIGKTTRCINCTHDGLTHTCALKMRQTFTIWNIVQFEPFKDRS